MYLFRDIDNALEAWRQEPQRKPLLLRGIRQCGKTSTVRHLSERFPHYIELNLEKQPSLHSVFEGDLDVGRILSRIEIEMGVPIIAGETLLFIDEIQACPRAVTTLRYLYEEKPDLHVIAAGSLLEFALHHARDKEPFEFPVGRVRSLFMYPLSFREYLRGANQTMLADYLENLQPETDDNDLHETLLEHYKTFLIVGGMPEAVTAYLETQSFLSCQRVHQDILLNMIDDFDKYDSDIEAQMLRRVFDYAIHHICSQTKASSAVAGISAYYFEECLKLLRRAGLVFPVKASACEALPLGASEKETNKKLLVFDTGVYLTHSGLDVGDLLSAKVFDEMNKGAVVELQTGLELIKSADFYADSALFYWYRSGANAEVDYVISRGMQIIPLEVKASGKGSMQSMYRFLQTHPKSPYGIRVSLENFGCYEQIQVCPVYGIAKL